MAVKAKLIVGKALLDGLPRKVKIATKLPAFSISQEDEMNHIIAVQLKKLQTDHIDYYLLHSLEAEVWKKMQHLNGLKFLEKAKADGKIVNAGFSFHGSLRTFKEIVDANDWAMCQIQYNFLDKNLQAGTEAYSMRFKKTLHRIIMEPLRADLQASFPRVVAI
jgi:predicted aldo/keto reductase-like oxidoreductase